MNYIKKDDFHSSKEFLKINRGIDFCLKLIERLISNNIKCRKEVEAKHSGQEDYKDFRIAQFGYYENILRAIYYDCLSLKHIYNSSTYMNHKGISGTIGGTFENQKKYVTFNAIVRMSSMFEWCGNKFDETIKGKYFETIKEKYPNYGDSLKLLKDFRNTIHNNGIWNGLKVKGNKYDNTPLDYELRTGKQIIKKGEVFKYDDWKLYRIFNDCINLHTALALENKPKRVRETRYSINGQKIVAVKTDMTLNDFDKLFDSSKE